MLVTIDDLRFHYSADNAAILNIPHWQLASGEQVFLHGPSGTGKSTLLNLIAGVLLPSQGRIEILGNNTAQLSGRQRDTLRAKHIGVVFQQFNLIPFLSAVDNIKLAGHFAGNKNTTARAKALLSALGLAQSDQHRATGRLSIGQQQRIAIARALINQPELLIVDEPTSALDKKNANKFMGLLMEQLSEGNTALIFVSHDPRLAKPFDRVESLLDINRAEVAL